MTPDSPKWVVGRAVLESFRDQSWSRAIKRGCPQSAHQTDSKGRAIVFDSTFSQTAERVAEGVAARTWQNFTMLFLGAIR